MLFDPSFLRCRTGNVSISHLSTASIILIEGPDNEKLYLEYNDLDDLIECIKIIAKDHLKKEANAH